MPKPYKETYVCVVTKDDAGNVVKRTSMSEDAFQELETKAAASGEAPPESEKIQDFQRYVFESLEDYATAVTSERKQVSNTNKGTQIDETNYIRAFMTDPKKQATNDVLDLLPILQAEPAERKRAIPSLSEGLRVFSGLSDADKKELYRLMTEAISQSSAA